MKKRKLGKNGPEVSVIGLGCMGMSEFYGKTDDRESEKVILKALEEGITMLDTADMYGFGHNEELLGRVLQKWKGEVFLATKFGIVRKPGEYKRIIDNSPEYINKAIEASLRRLKRDYVDLYYVHRLNDQTPVEETTAALALLVKQGKVRYIGFSEISAKTIERAHAVHPVTALQTEYSLFSRGVEKEILPVLERLGIGFVPYSPLGRGFLSGSLNKAAITDGDFRKMLPRTSGENYDYNQGLVKKLADIASARGIKPAQMALAWVISRGDYIVPIPGTKREKYLMENIGSVDVELDESEIDALGSIFYPGAVRGNRYSDAGMVGIEE
ncbi:MAG: General stress protein 69 [Smithella sp. PtaU1.Bin162]|nr:MAG: General stress protein 69 [Smithella sp. PtaU1.Bin162]